MCINCGENYSRDAVQQWINGLNPRWAVDAIGELAPDGDVEISEEALMSFSTPHCPRCGPKSILKTNVVFFGDNVPMKLVEECYAKVPPMIMYLI